MTPTKGSAQKLSKKEALAYSSEAWEKAQKNHRDAHSQMWKERVMKSGDHSMPFDVRVYGEKPVGGRSLYISMHGGGNTAKAVNDQQ